MTSLPADARIIDMHCHVAGIGAGGSGCMVSEALRTSWKYGIYLKAFGVTPQEIETHGDSIVFARLSNLLAASDRVDSAVALAMDMVVDDRGREDPGRTEVYIPDAFVAEGAAAYDNLLYGASVHPLRRDWKERVDRAVDHGAVLMKWLPSIQHIDPGDTRLVPYYEHLAEVGLPLLTHTGGERSFTTARNELADPARLELPLEVGVTVIAAHGASSGRNEGVPNMVRLLALLERFDNLLTDISSLTQINRLPALPRLLKHTHVHDRLLYGTDMPLIATAAVSPLYFLHRLSPWRIFSLLSIRNPFDRDVLLKKALGVPEAVFTRPGAVLYSAV